MIYYQHVNELNDEDGIGNDIQGFVRLFKNKNIENYIITLKNNSNILNNVITSQNTKIDYNSIHIFHYAGFGYPLSTWLQRPIKKKILRFHNFTPSYFFKNVLSEYYYSSLIEQEQKSVFELSSYNKQFQLSLADSHYNNQLLTYLNYKNSKVIPILMDYSIKNRFIHNNAPIIKIGFVGRFSPNKKIEDLIKLMSYLVKLNPYFKLILIGKKIPFFINYYNYILDMMTQYNLNQYIEIKENCSDSQLLEEYRTMNFYVSMSEHEGFGIPILEAFSNSIPVIAYNIPAVKEIMRDAGILIKKKFFEEIALLIYQLSENEELKNDLISSQHKSLKYYQDFDFQSIFNYEN